MKISNEQFRRKLGKICFILYAYYPDQGNFHFYPHCVVLTTHSRCPRHVFEKKFWTMLLKTFINWVLNGTIDCFARGNMTEHRRNHAVHACVFQITRPALWTGGQDFGGWRRTCMRCQWWWRTVDSPFRAAQVHWAYGSVLVMFPAPS